MRLNALIIAALAASAATASAATAKKITDPDVALEQARDAFYDYDPATSREMYETYEALMKKKKRAVPEEVEAEMSRLVMMENMLSRVEKIAIVDSLVVDADSFFKHYRLAPEAGRFVAGEALKVPGIEMAYVPQNRTRILYADLDSADRFVLMSADILDDGRVERPTPLRGDDLASGGNAEYPFMLSDGLTLYYAADGDASLGGYDIFLTRQDDDGTFLQPQNIGMPFNSPYDDYLLAIDETTGAGWWATDRNQIPGKVTIYVFVPSEARVNVDSDSPDLRSLARLDNIAIARADNAEAVKQRIGAAQTAGPSVDNTAVDFSLPIGSATRIYHRLGDFRSPQARRTMAQALEAGQEVERIESRLAELRRQYGAGKRDTGVAILNLEQQLAEARQRRDAAINKAIAEELQ